MTTVNTNIPKISSVKVVSVRPESMDKKRLQFAYQGRNEATPNAMFLVKIYFQEGMLATGQGAALYIGDRWVRKYTAFPGGIFFNVYEPDFFETHAGSMIRFSTDHEKFYDTNMRLPARPRATSAEGATVVADTSLPSKAEALKN